VPFGWLRRCCGKRGYGPSRREITASRLTGFASPIIVHQSLLANRQSLPAARIFWDWQIDFADGALQFTWRGWKIQAIG
jgi:hypothetical protein